MSESLIELVLLLGKLSLLSVGGSPTILGEMQRQMVGRGWMSPDQFATAFALSQVVPGPPTLLVIPLGYLINGYAGAVAAFLAFSVPTTVIALVAARLWSRLREAPWARAVRIAVTPIASGLILASVYTLGRSTIREIPMLVLGTGIFLALWRLRLSISLAVPLGAAVGAVLAILAEFGAAG
jgi:chromate transporter